MLDAPALVRAMALYAQALEESRDELDSLNVFPVPDGDTGTNLLHTQRAVVDALSAAGNGGATPDLPAVAETIAHAALTGARGNSGVILSQVLRALCGALPSPGADGRATARALLDAAAAARRAVAEPKEGTILTVLDAAANSADRAGRPNVQAEGVDTGDVLEAALAAAREALGRTPTLLPELRAAGVVDAGGKGAVLLIDAIRAAVTNGELSEQAGPAGPVGHEAGRTSAAPLTFAYEVEFLLAGAGDGSLRELRGDLAGMGDSLAIVGGDALYRVHIHTDRPDEVLAAAGRTGTVHEAATTSLESQVADCLGRAARGVQAGSVSPGGQPGPAACALIAVLEPSGVADALRSLGAVIVEPAAETERTVERLIEARASIPAQSAVVLVEKARASVLGSNAALADLGFVLVPGLPAAISAAAEFNPDAGKGPNVAAMGAAAARLRSAVVQSSDGAIERSVAQLAAETPDAEVLTLVAGTGVTDDDLAAVSTTVAQRFPALRIETLRGPAATPAYQVGLE